MLTTVMLPMINCTLAMCIEWIQAIVNNISLFEARFTKIIAFYICILV